MKKRLACSLLCWTVAFGTGVGLLPLDDRAEASAPADRPNILLIITDQQHAGMMSCAGNPYLQTPAMDQLAARGVRFERAYCGNPVCVPSRFSMMTGVLPSRIGMEKNGQAEVPEEILAHAMGTVFRAHGYTTAYGGKVHLPGPRAEGIAAYGFDYLIRDEREELAKACGEFFHQKHDKPFLLVASFINPHDICYMAIDAYTRAESKQPMYPQSSRERECLAEALKLPGDRSREEFFRTVCPPLPANFEIPVNEPGAARDSDWRGFRKYVQESWSEDDWRLHRWAYARLTERVDAHIGQVLDALHDAGLERDTVVVLTSDHGDLDAAHRLEHKSMPYEEATHVPLIVSHPSATLAGHVDTTHLVSTGLDLIPTLCDFAGIPAPSALSGRSVKPLAIKAEAPGPWRECLVAENEGCRVLWSKRYKYAVYGHGRPREMLIDLRNDPGEMRNLAVEPEYRDEVHRHRELLQEWYTEYGEPLNERYVVSGPWPPEKAWDWYARQPWLVGCNFLPSTAVNDVEMWQADTFDAATIERELGWAHKLGFTTIRVFLNYVAWKADPEGLKRRVDEFLKIADGHGISVMPILFDDCNFAGRVAAPGRQPDPIPGVHNSQWVSSPPLEMVTDQEAWPDLERYTKDLVSRFGKDDRVVAWDLYNEPGNSGMGQKSLPLVEAVFAWAREAKPKQPLTIGAWADLDGPMSRRLMELSDVVSFHGYDTVPGVKSKIELCRRYGRPILCTEWLHRQSGSTVEAILPTLQAERVGCYNWGLVYGRTQTYMPWGSQRGDPVPALWQHDLLHPDGKAYREEELERISTLIRRSHAPAGLVPIFDGKTLDGWHAVPKDGASDWTVRDGVIVGRGSEDRQCYLVWKEDDLADFELELRYRLPGEGNTGIEIRSRPDPSGKRPFEGYHADLGHVGIGPHILGAWDFHFATRREYPCPRGTRLVIDADGEPHASPIPGALTLEEVRPHQWNDVRVVARENQFQFFINGKLTSEFTDNAKEGRLDRGAIGLQIHDKGMVVEFQDIRLKRGTSSVGPDRQ